MKPRRGKVIYLQISAAVVSLLLGLFNLSKESAPLIQKMQTNQNLRRQEENARKATEIAQMQIQWQYRNNDGVWNYYSDPTGRYWCRVNIQGICEYSENPEYSQRRLVASVRKMIR